MKCARKTPFNHTHKTRMKREKNQQKITQQPDKMPFGQLNGGAEQLKTKEIDN